MTKPSADAEAALEHGSEQQRPDRVGVRDRSVGRLGRALRFVRERGISEVFLLARTHGFRETCRFIGRNIRSVIAARADRRFDRRHCVDTAGTIPLDFLSVVGSNRDYATEYVSTSPKSFAWMMQHVDRDLSGYVFIDFGAGKGRTVLLAAGQPFSRVLGVEFAKELATVAQQNLRSYRSQIQQCRRMKIINADAAEFKFPKEPLVLYFYNPFGPEVLRQVMNNLGDSLKTHPRNCLIVYSSSFGDPLGWVRPLIVGTGLFEEVETRPMPLFLDAVRSLHFAVFSRSAW